MTARRTDGDALLNSDEVRNRAVLQARRALAPRAPATGERPAPDAGDDWPATPIDGRLIGKLKTGNRRPCPTCASDGLYRRVVAPEQPMGNARAYVCRHRHWLFVEKPKSRDFPPAVRRVAGRLEEVDG